MKRITLIALLSLVATAEARHRNHDKKDHDKKAHKKDHDKKTKNCKDKNACKDKKNKNKKACKDKKNCKKNKGNAQVKKASAQSIRINSYRQKDKKDPK